MSGSRDDTTADVDLSYLLDYGGVFEPLRDPAYFARLTEHQLFCQSEL
jgi:hypothetical protein